MHQRSAKLKFDTYVEIPARTNSQGFFRMI